MAALVFAIGFDFRWPPPEHAVDTFLLVMMFGSVMGAYPAAALVGFPAYLLLRGRVRPTVIVCAMTGAFIGVLTALAWKMTAEALALAFVAGAIGGGVFWITARSELASDDRD